MGEFIQSIQMLKVYIILFALAYIFFDESYSKGLGPDPFSRGKSCTSNSDCNTAAGVTCCGAGNAWGRCCPDGLCLTNCTYGDTTFDYCGTYCPDYPKTTQSTPAYLSTTTTGGTTSVTTVTTASTTVSTTVTTTGSTTVTTTDPNASTTVTTTPATVSTTVTTTTGSTTVTTTDPNASTPVTTTPATVS